MHKVMIVDNKQIIREGLIDLVDFNVYGLDLCEDEINGEEVLKKILEDKIVQYALLNILDKDVVKNKIQKYQLDLKYDVFSVAIISFHRQKNILEKKQKMSKI